MAVQFQRPDHQLYIQFIGWSTCLSSGFSQYVSISSAESAKGPICQLHC